MQVAIMLYPGMTALDAVGPYEILRSLPHCELRFVWKEVGPIVTDSGVLVLGATHTFTETPRPDLVLVPGSSSRTATTAASQEVRNWLAAVHSHTRFTTSVCSGSLILAAAGLLEGRAATSHWAALPYLSAWGAQPRPRDRIVRDGKVWTAAGVSAGIDLALALTAVLTDDDNARVQQLTIEYDPQPPFDCGHIDKAPQHIRERAEREMKTQSLNVAEAVAIPQLLTRAFARAIYRKVRKAAAPNLDPKEGETSR